MRFPALFALLPLALTGCSVMTTTATPGSFTGAAITGKAYGGQQPIVGAHVYLMAANATGYGGPGIAPSTANASISLLTSATGLADTVGNYVLTDASGNFTITGDYSCTANQQVYLYTLGGNPGAGTNSAAALLALLGSCPGGTFPASQNVWVNEVTTIAAAYSFAGFASDASHVSSSGTTLAQTGIANAFANSTNLVNPKNGSALATTPAGNGIVPQQELNTLANILASCVNSVGPASGTNPCSTLFNNTTAADSTSNPPTDTATAAINIAHNPGANVATLYNIPPPTLAFGNALTTQPNDFTIMLNFSTTSFGVSVAIDAQGDAWMAYDPGPIRKLSPLGAVLSGTGFTDGFQTLGVGSLAIGTTGDVFVADYHTDTISKFSNSGAVLSGATAYPGPSNLGNNGPFTLAVDSADFVWIGTENYTYDVYKMSDQGAIIAGPYGPTDMLAPASLQVDGSGNVWVANNDLNSVAKISSGGLFLSGANGFTTDLQYPRWLAVDGTGSVWVSTFNGMTKLSNSGSVLAFNTTPLRGIGVAIDGAGNAWVPAASSTTSSTAGLFKLSQAGVIQSTPTGYTYPSDLVSGLSIAIDGSGNLWSSGVEYIGIAAPVITPLAAALPATRTLDGSSSLGTRP